MTMERLRASLADRYRIERELGAGGMATVGDRVFYTYSTYQRGLDPLLNTYNLLDLTPLGRQEEEGIIVYFELDDLDSAVRQLVRAGLRFESSPRDQPWLWREAHLRDPAGNRICLYHAGVNRRDPPWRLPQSR